MKLPKAKTDNIVVQNLNDETLIYDLTTDRAFCLNETSAVVFNACDGRRTFDELKTEHRLTDEIVFLAVDNLKKENLLEENSEYVSPFAGLSRREAIKKAGLTSMIAVPVIATLIAPQAITAASVCNVGRGCQCPTSGNCTAATCGTAAGCQCANATIDENGRNCAATGNPCLGTCARV